MEQKFTLDHFKINVVGAPSLFHLYCMQDLLVMNTLDVMHYEENNIWHKGYGGCSRGPQGM
jgi:hypothetical protein